MDDRAVNKLCQIVAKYGQGIVDDPRRLKALLADVCPGLARETHVLVTATERGVPRDLLGSATREPWALLSARVARRLADETGLRDDATRWAVEGWGAALGLRPRTAAPAARAAKPADPRARRRSGATTVPVGRPAGEPPPKRTRKRPADGRKRRGRGCLVVGTIGMLSLVALSLAVAWLWPNARLWSSLFHGDFAQDRQPDEASNTAVPVPFDAELALLPDDCDGILSFNASAAKQLGNTIPQNDWVDLFETDSDPWNDLFGDRLLMFEAFTGKQREEIRRLTGFMRRASEPKSETCVLCQLASRIDVQRVPQEWSMGIGIDKSAIINKLEKKRANDRDNWVDENKKGAYLPSSGDWPPGPDGIRPDSAQLLSGQTLIVGDVEGLVLGPKRPRLPAESPLAGFLRQNETQSALAAAFLARAGLDEIVKVITLFKGEVPTSLAALLKDARYVSGRLNQIQNEVRLTCTLGYGEAGAADQAVLTLDQLRRAITKEWQENFKKEMLKSLADQTPDSAKRGEALLNELSDALHIETARDGSVVSVVIRLDFTPSKLLHEFAEMARAEKRAKDEATARFVNRLTDAAGQFQLSQGRKPNNLDELLVDKYVPEKEQALKGTWGQYRFQYDSRGLHNRERRPDIWAATPSGAIIPNWSQSSGALGSKSETFRIRLMVDGKDGNCYSLFSSTDRLNLDAVKEALQKHTRQFPESDTVRLVIPKRIYRLFEGVRDIRSLAKDNGYRFQLDVAER